MTRSRTTYANLTATLALAVALGSGGAYAAGLAKDSVRSPQVKNGSIKSADVRDNSITGADVDESSLQLPAAPAPAALPAVFAGPTEMDVIALDGRTFVDVATFSYTAPADGYVLVEGAASLNARATGLLWCLLTHDTTDAAAVYWDTGDVDSAEDLRQTVEGAVKVTKGQHTVTLSLREHQPAAPGGGSAPAWSSVTRTQIIVEFFPAGSVAGLT